MTHERYEFAIRIFRAITWANNWNEPCEPIAHSRVRRRWWCGNGYSAMLSQLNRVMEECLSSYGSSTPTGKRYEFLCMASTSPWTSGGRPPTDAYGNRADGKYHRLLSGGQMFAEGGEVLGTYRQTSE